MISLVMLLAFAAPPGTAAVDGGRWHQLTQDAAAEDEQLPRPYAADREVVLTPVDGGLRVDVLWRVRTLRPGWFSGMLLGSGVEAHLEYVRWNGRPAAYTTDRQGSVVFGYAERDVVIELRAFVPGDPVRAQMSIDLLPAVTGELSVAGGGEQRPRVRDRAAGQQLVRRRGVFSTGSATLAVELVDASSPTSDTARPDLVVARAGLGLTIGEAELRGRGRVVWEVRHGALERVSLSATGIGDDLIIEGPNVRDWKRSGDRIEVELQQPSRDRVDIQLRWSAAVAKGTESSMVLPRLEPHDAFRTESSVQLARDGEIEVVPQLEGWQALAAAQVPDWGQGLVEGTPTASFRAAGTAPGTLELFRFVPVEGPPTVVDVAGYQVATSREGRLLMRAHYEVRNERAAHLRVQAPEGFAIIGAQVQGESALPARDEAGAWLIPLARSVETVEGLLSFPVEVILMGEADEWARRERRSLRVPVLDAPIATSRVTLYLPPGYRSLLEPGESDVVGMFTEGEGITYGLGVGDVGAGQADALFRQAVDAWLENDFDAAQGRLDDLRELGAGNENVDKLQANLQVVRGESTGKKVDVTMERRIKEQAKARALEDLEKERDAKKRAEDLKKSGDYVEAEQEYRRALDIGRRLEMLEQSESVEQQTKNSSYEESLAELEQDARSQKQDRARRKAEIADVPHKKAKGKAAKAGSLDVISGLETESATISSRERESPATVIDVYELENMPITGETSRDFTTAIDDPARGPSTYDEDGDFARDDVGISLQGTTAAEPPEEEIQYELEGANMSTKSLAKVSRAGGIQARRSRNRRSGRRAGRGGADGVAFGKAKAPARMDPSGAKDAVSVYDFEDDDLSGGLIRPEAVALVPEDLEPPAEFKASERDGEPLGGELDRLPDPSAHASSMSVTIPTAGEAVLYQRLLLAAGATFQLEIEAREPLLERNRR